MSEEKKHQLVEFTEDEANILKKDIEKVLNFYKAELIVAPIINQNGTIGAQLQVLKKVEVVAEPTLSPFVDQDGKILEEPKEDSEGETKA